MPQQDVARLETKPDCRVSTLCRLANALEVKASEMIGEPPLIIEKEGLTATLKSEIIPNRDNDSLAAGNSISL